MIYGPKADSTYIVEFRAADEARAISMPGSEAAVIRYFQSVCPMGSSCQYRNACRVGTYGRITYTRPSSCKKRYCNEC
jgi:hypothetical protein